MDALLLSFTADPLYYIGVVVAFVAALAFLVFLRGFLSGSPHMVTMSAHEEHLNHHRVRAIWGTLGMFGLIMLWELIRYLAGWIFGYDVPGAAAGLKLLIIYIIFALILWALFAIKDSVTS